MSKSKAPKTGSTVNASGSVDEFMVALDHPLKAEIEALRKIIRSVDKGISEHIKWNAPSFVFKDDFATLKLQPKTAIQIIFHTGAKPKGKKIEIDDLHGLLRWADDDRAVATFARMREIKSRKSALVAILKQWIAQM